MRPPKPAINLIRKSNRYYVLWYMPLLLGVSLFYLQTLAAYNSTPSNPDQSLSHISAPVVVKGADLNMLQGFETEAIAVYRYEQGQWQAIPSQIDERSAGGDFVSTEDARLDANDELVFMGKDAGEHAPDSDPITASLAVHSDWYELEITDPLSPAQKAWAYVAYRLITSSLVYSDYVDFDHGFHRIMAQDYQLGLGVTHIGADYLRFAQTASDVLDRAKIQIACNLPGICPSNETLITPVNDDLIRDGPVRVILRGGRVLAYTNMVQWESVYGIGVGRFPTRFSWDFNEVISGAIFYNEAIPQGVVIDGRPDTVPTQPYSAWRQVSSTLGSLILIDDLSAVGGQASNYYRDDTVFDPEDTGDRLHYGDSGVLIDNPALNTHYAYQLYILPPEEPNRGAEFLAYARNGLRVHAAWRGQNQLYLPLLLGGD